MTTHKVPLLILAFLGLLALSWSLLAAVPGVLAAEPTPTPVITDDMVNAVAKQLYCPVCENIPLDVCGTQACAQWRELIREKLQQGWTEDQIKAYFVQQYGERVLATPPPKGFNLLVYVLPPVAILAGIFILYRALQAWQQGSPEPTASPPASPTAEEEDEYLRQVEEALKR